MVFWYAQTAHTRRHGPRGYIDYRSIKQWLRDEFCFMCVYCLARERWYPSAADGFSADHVVAQTHDRSRVNDYTNLVYACVRCNARKVDVVGLPNPTEVAFGELLEVNGDGTILSDRAEGRRLIRVLKLDAPQLVEHRRQMLSLYGDLSRDHRHERLRYFFGFPDDMPDLSKLRPPGGNSRPEGLDECWFAKRRRGELTETY